MSEETRCPYCGHEITKKEFTHIQKRLEREASVKYDDKISQLQATLQGREQHIKEINMKNAKVLDRIITENEHKINEIAAANDRLVSELCTERQEDKLQMTRLQKEFENINDKLRKRQSELIGEVGEIQLLETLQETFKEDSFNMQSRGTSEADIVQTVHHNNMPLDIRICYDNKQKTMVTKAHVDKAKKYQQIHNTRYVFVVSSVLSKKDTPNSFFGVKDGILLVHPAIIIEVVKLVRSNLIEIHTKRTTQESRDSKETELYEFITGHQFTLKLSVISNCYSKLDELLKSEMNSHARNWKQQRRVLDELFRTKIDIEQNINVITEKTIQEVQMSMDDMTEIEQ